MLTILAATALLVSGNVARHGSEFRPGTYAIRVCADNCTFDNDQNVLAAGLVVLDSGYWSLEHFAADPDYDFQLAYIGTRSNGCYLLERLQDEARVYAGISPRGLTLWHQSARDSLVRFPIYLSPDASYDVQVSATSSGFAGRGRSSGVGAANPGRVPAQRVIGRRIGPPDMQICLDAWPAGDVRAPETPAPIYVNDYIVGPPIIALFDQPIDTAWLRFWSGSLLRVDGVLPAGRSQPAWVRYSYPDYEVAIDTAGIGMSAALTSSRYTTYRGLGLGDSAGWVQTLYGEPDYSAESGWWVYEDTERRRRHHAGICVRLEDGRVRGIRAGILNDSQQVACRLTMR